MPPPAPTRTRPTGRMDLTKLSRWERKDIEERRKNYLLSHFGTEEQRLRYSALADGPPPYDIFADIPETSPMPATMVAIEPDWGLVGDGVTLDPSQVVDPMPGEGYLDTQASIHENSRIAPGDGAGLAVKEAAAIQSAVVGAGVGAGAARAEAEDEPGYKLVQNEAGEAYPDFHDGGGLVQYTAMPIKPATLPSTDLPHAHNAQPPPRLDLPSTEYLLWWIVAIGMLLFATARFRKTRAWRRILSGAGKSDR